MQATKYRCQGSAVDQCFRKGTTFKDIAYQIIQTIEKDYGQGKVVTLTGIRTTSSLFHPKGLQTITT